MADTSTNYYNALNFSASQSILDVFVIQDLIDQDDAKKLRVKFKTNREIESFLVKNRIVTAETINKAYSIILKLPYVELKNFEIPEKLKALIPERLIRRFGIIPFALEQGSIRIALARPAELLVGFRQNLGKIFAKEKLDVELFITSEADFNECLKQYGKKYKKSTLLKKGRFPIVYLRNQIISKEYLDKIPKEFVLKYRLVVFGRNSRGYFLVACEQPDSPIILKILNFIRQENKIGFEVFATSKEDIDYAVNLIDGKTDSPEVISAEPDKKEEAQIPIATESTEVPKTEKKEEKKSAFRGLIENFIESTGPELVIDSVENTASIAEKPVKKEIKSETDSEQPTKVEETPQLAQPSESPKLAETTQAPQTVESSEIGETSESLKSVQPPKSPQVPKSNNESDREITEVAKPRDDASETIALLDNKNLGAWLNTEITTEAELAEFAKNGSVPKIVAATIDFALNNRSSDIHVEAGAKFVRIRCRVDGILREILKLPLSLHAPLVSRVKIMSKLKIDEMRVPQDGRFDTIFNGREVDVRVSTLPTVHGEKVVMRILDKSQGILSLEDLGMTGSAIDKTIEAISKPYGIILSTGPTGSGKSTTLYAVLNRISMPGVNIVTLEDPVEYEIGGINQCQIKPEIGFTFATGLRSILRQDPNVIMVGEIRDAETAAMGVHAALTGHLVLSTLHTNDTAGALPRLINMGVEPFLITSSLNLVVAQRLIRRICPKCKEEYKAPQRLMDQIKAELDKIPEANAKDRARIPAEIKLFHGKGCSECNQGFKGRLGIFEAMTMSPEIEELATAKRPANEIKEASIKSGMITMKQDGLLKAVAGETTIDEVYQAVISE